MTTLFNPIMDNLWKPSLWVNGILTDTDSPSINLYNFYLSLPSLTDSVSSTVFQSTNDSGRFNYAGTEFAADVPVIESDGSLLTCGAYTVENGKSNDISDAIWTKYLANADAVNELIATARYGSITKLLNTTEGVFYTISFYAYVGPGDRATGFYMYHSNSATSARTAITLSETRTRYSLAVLGKAGGGNVSFGFQDNNTSNWSKVYIDTINVTEGAILYPPAINTTTAAMSVPANYADATHGSKIPINSTDTPQLLDALDGVADGTVVLDDDFSTDTSGSYTGFDTTISYDGTDKLLKATYTTIAGVRGIYVVNSLSGETEKLDVTFRARGTRFRSFYGIGESITVGTDIENPVLATSWQDYHFRLDPPYTNHMRLYQGPAGGAIGDYVEFDNLSVKEISPAQGKMVVEWTPMFDYTAMTVLGAYKSRGILSVNNELSSVMYLRNNGVPDGVTMRIYDGSTAKSSPDVDFQAGILYTITAQYGPHPDYADALKMQITVTDGTTTWTSAVADFDGSFDPGDYLSFGWDNEYPQDIKLVSIEKEPGW